MTAVAPATVAPTIVAPATVGPAVAPAVAPATVAAAAVPAGVAPVAPSGPPVIGTIGAPAQQVPAAMRQAVYVPPTSRIPDPPQTPGKWQPQYSRDFKSYVVPGLDGIRQTDTLTRATSHAKMLGDDTKLGDWRLQTTVMGLARSPELLDNISLDGAELFSELDFSAKRALASVARKAARRVGADDGSDFGTKLHGYLQAILEGTVTLDEVPEILQPYLAVVFEAMRRHGLNFVAGMCERTVFIPATGMVGTFDFMVMDADGVLMIGDLKTSNSIDYSWLSIGVQLAQYAGSTLILSWDGSSWSPMPEVSQVVAKVLSVPKDETVPSCRVYTVNLALGAEMMEMASRVKAVQESARRGASNPERYGAGDELMAWADGDVVQIG